MKHIFLWRTRNIGQCWVLEARSEKYTEVKVKEFERVLWTVGPTVLDDEIFAEIVFEYFKQTNALILN